MYKKKDQRMVPKLGSLLKNRGNPYPSLAMPFGDIYNPFIPTSINFSENENMSKHPQKP